jgi:hypothetical protein
MTARKNPMRRDGRVEAGTTTHSPSLLPRASRARERSTFIRLANSVLAPTRSRTREDEILF